MTQLDAVYMKAIMKELGVETPEEARDRVRELVGVVENVREKCNYYLQEFSPPSCSPMNLVACAMRIILNLLPARRSTP